MTIELKPEFGLFDAVFTVDDRCFNAPDPLCSGATFCNRQMPCFEAVLVALTYSCHFLSLQMV